MSWRCKCPWAVERVWSDAIEQCEHCGMSKPQESPKEVATVPPVVEPDYTALMELVREIASIWETEQQAREEMSASRRGEDHRYPSQKTLALDERVERLSHSRQSLESKLIWAARQARNQASKSAERTEDGA